MYGARMSSSVNDTSVLRLSTDNVIIRNLRAATFKMAVEKTPDAVTCITYCSDLLFVGIAHNGINVYRVNGNCIVFVGRLGEHCSCCYDLMATTQHLVYITQEETGQQSIFVHPIKSFVNNDITEGQRSQLIQRRAPFTLESTLGIVVIGGAAWTSSWMSDSAPSKLTQDVDERDVVVLDLETFKLLSHWKAVENSVAIVHSSIHNTQCLLGVADSRSGVSVYQLTAPSAPSIDHTHTCLYHIDVDQVRNFQLVGPCVAVFHRFEPNISFWNIVEQRTILCINVQDQTRQLSEEFTINSPDDDDLEDSSLLIEDDDYVTSVTSLPVDGGADHLLIYGTVSGCVFGMSVQRRSKIFSVPFPHVELCPQNAVQGLAFLSTGQLITAYHGRNDLTILNFGVDNPPDRPPTRCVKREKP